MQTSTTRTHGRPSLTTKRFRRIPRISLRWSETGQIRFRRAQFQTPSSVSFLAHQVPGRELSEFLSAFCLCAKVNSPSFFAELTEFAVKLREFSLLSGPQEGPAERGHIKKRQKWPKSVKYIFDIFRLGRKKM